MAGLLSLIESDRNMLLAPLNGGTISTDQWLFVYGRFQKFLKNLQPTDIQKDEVSTMATGILNCLNQSYWGNIPQGLTSFILAGSWAKQTQVRLASDLDMIYLLPWEVAQKFHYQDKKQSRILQEVKNILLLRYPNSEINADGPTVVVKFEKYKIEIAPAFLSPGSPIYIYDHNFKVLLCDTNNGGSYKLTAPAADRAKAQLSNTATNGNFVTLMCMMKIWKYNCSVPIKSFVLEQIAIDFLTLWKYADKDYFWYDWMVRDFFAYMLTRQNGTSLLPITNELIYFGDEWVSRTETALSRARRACTFEQFSLNAAAGEEWQKIFNNLIPKEI